MTKKNVTNTAKLLLYIWNVGLFVWIWFFYYSQFTLNTYQKAGSIVSCLIYLVLYMSLCNLYKAFRIASSSIGETVFSQLISFGIADFIMYIECCLIYNRYVNIFPGAGAVVAQISGTTIIVLFTKRYFMNHVPPKKTLLVYGKEIKLEEIEQFKKRILKKYEHLFRITEMYKENIQESTFEELLKRYDTCLLYELSDDKRGYYLCRCMEAKKQFYFTPRIEDILYQGCTPKHLLDTPLMKYEYKYEDIKGYFGKRILDIVLSIVGLVIAAPIMLLIAIAIKMEDGGPILYKQKRCTKDARVFEILKFRSMVVDAEKNGMLPCTSNDSRITKTGNIIRALRIDELPQLINILKGDMSFVGPRPERVEHVEQYTGELPEFEYRLRVPGGLTGYAQIYGKYNTSAYDKLRLDLMYIEQQSLLLDLKLIMLTVRTLFQKESTEGFEEEKSRMIERENRKAKAKESQVIPMESGRGEYTELKRMVK